MSKIRQLAASGRLRAMREARQVSLRELAALIGVSPASLSRWETGEARPRPATALRWADALNSLSGKGRAA